MDGWCKIHNVLIFFKTAQLEWVFEVKQMIVSHPEYKNNGSYFVNCWDLFPQKCVKDAYFLNPLNCFCQTARMALISRAFYMDSFTVEKIMFT